MNTKQLEIFRDTILRALKASADGGMSLVTLEITLRACGFRNFEDSEIEAELRYFLDKGFVAEVPKSHSFGNPLWRITAAGTDDLEKRGL